MKFKNILGIDCSKAAHVCDKVQYNEAGFREKLRLRLHLLFCGNCKKFTSDNRKLSDLLNRASLKTCTKQEKENFRQRMEEDRQKKS